MKLKSLYVSAVAVLLQMFFVTELSAQISSYQGFPGSSSGLQVLVVDSLSMKPLPSVVIKAVQNKDTLYAYTDESGHASISRLAPKDSVTVSASLLGFKPLTRKIAHIGSTMVTIIMDEDPVELNASVKYAFGKDRRFAIAVNGTDLLNNSRSENISFTELYVLTTRQSLLGRCVYVSFSMKFR